jgi:hypothetical protein
MMRILTEPLLLPVLISGMIAVACIWVLLLRGAADPEEEISVELDPWTDF